MTSTVTTASRSMRVVSDTSHAFVDYRTPTGRCSVNWNIFLLLFLARRYDILENWRSYSRSDFLPAHPGFCVQDYFRPLRRARQHEDLRCGVHSQNAVV